MKQLVLQRYSTLLDRFLCLLVSILLLSAASLRAAPAASTALNVANFHKDSSPTAGIQETIDALPNTGGTVFIPAGTYEIIRSINLRSGIRLYGEGQLTVITRQNPCLQVRLTAPAKKGDTKITLEDTEGFKAGQQICVRSDTYAGWECTHAIITKVKGNMLSLDEPLAYDYLPRDNALALNFFPAIYASDAQKIRVEDLVIDGQMKKGHHWKSSFVVSAVHFKDVRDALIARVHVRSYPADGFSIQGGDNITVTQCISEYNLEHGYHPGTSITASSWTDNVGRYNRGDGLYFCCDVRYNLVSGNRFHNNGGHGIGELGECGPDRYNVVSDNFCYNNGRCGIECREGANNIVVNNICQNNSRAEPGIWPGILVKDTKDSIISKNLCICLDFKMSDSLKTQGYGILVTNNSKNNVITDNILSGHPKAGLAGDALEKNTVSNNIIIAAHESPDR